MKDCNITRTYQFRCHEHLKSETFATNLNCSIACSVSPTRILIFSQNMTSFYIFQIPAKFQFIWLWTNNDEKKSKIKIKKNKQTNKKWPHLALGCNKVAMSLNKLSFNIGYIFNLSLNVCWKVNMEGVIQTTSTNHFQITKRVGGIRRQSLWSSPILPKSPESSKNENDFLIILSFFLFVFCWKYEVRKILRFIGRLL